MSWKGILLRAGLRTDGTNLTLTDGDITLTNGDLLLTSGDATIDTGSLTVSAGSLAVTTGDLTVGGAFELTGLASLFGGIQAEASGKTTKVFSYQSALAVSASYTLEASACGFAVSMTSAQGMLLTVQPTGVVTKIAGTTNTDVTTSASASCLVAFTEGGAAYIRTNVAGGDDATTLFFTVE